MVGVVQNNFFSAGCRWIIPEPAVRIGGYPVGWTVKKSLVVPALILKGHAHRVLKTFLVLVFLDQVDHVVLPPRRGWMCFIGNFIKHVVQVIHGVDYFLNIGLLNSQRLIVDE